MPIPEPHETFMIDLNYRIAEADRNCAMQAATAATLRSLKDLFERRLSEWKRDKERDAKRAESEREEKPGPRTRASP